MDQSTSGDATPTSVYRYYDSHGILIYVGITSRGIGRNREHNRRAEWWPHVGAQEVDHFLTRAQALDVERDLIQRFRPPFNSQHNPNYRAARAEYLTMVEQFPPDESFMDLWRRMARVLPLNVVEDDGETIVASSHLAFSAVARTVATHRSRVPIRDRHGKASGVTGDISRSGGALVVTLHVSPRVEPRAPIAARLRLVSTKSPITTEIVSVSIDGVRRPKSCG